MDSPYTAYPQSHQDVLSALLQNSMVSNNVAADKRHTDMGQQAKQYANQYQLQALQNQMAIQEQQNNMLQTRMSGMYGSAGNVLQGLFR
jgi:hypothetical protein